MKKTAFLFVLLLAFLTAAVHAAPVVKQKNRFITLCYHDVADDANGNPYTVRTKDLIEQFEYLKANYKVVGLDEVQAAGKGGKALPEKAVLITVDDGLASFYEIIFPLLKIYQFKAVFAIVGKWTDEGGKTMATWKQLKEMSDSGLVQVVSHSYDMHRGAIFNPQLNEAPMAGFPSYDPVTKSYESDQAFKDRVQKDLQKSVDQIQEQLKTTTPAIVWPYGAFSGLSMDAAQKVGLNLNFSILEGWNHASDLRVIRRALVMAGTRFQDFTEGLETGFISQAPLRVLRLDLDQIIDSDPQKQEHKLGQWIEAIRILGPNAVYLKAVSEKEPGTVYFPNKILPVRQDLLNRAAHVISQKTSARAVYAWLPDSIIDHVTDASARESFFNELAKHNDLAGVMFEESPRGAAVKGKKGKIDSTLTTPIADLRKIRPLWSFVRAAKLQTASGTLKKWARQFDRVLLESETAPKPKEVARALAQVGPDQLILNVQVVDAKNQRLPDAQLRKQAQFATNHGIRHLSYGPAHFLSSRAWMDEMRAQFSGSGNLYELVKGEIK